MINIKKSSVLFALLSVTSIAISQQCLAEEKGDFYVGGRGAYLTASNYNQPAIYAGYNAANGFGFLLTDTYNAGKMNQLVSQATELEMWYPIWKPSENVSIHVGGLVDSASDGSSSGIYTGISYNLSKDQSVMFRYRFNQTHHDTLNADGEMDRYQAHMFILTYNLQITDSLNYYFETEYYSALNGFKQGNGKDGSSEIHHQLTYKINEHWSPYVEVAWLDKVATLDKQEYRTRFGVNYHF